MLDAGTWVEMRAWMRRRTRHSVAPLYGAWIEMVCGSKYLLDGAVIRSAGVAPCIGAWIEMRKAFNDLCTVSHPAWVRESKNRTIYSAKVALGMSAWVEIRLWLETPSLESHPTRVCGLKSRTHNQLYHSRVALLARGSK